MNGFALFPADAVFLSRQAESAQARFRTRRKRDVVRRERIARQGELEDIRDLADGE